MDAGARILPSLAPTREEGHDRRPSRGHRPGATAPAPHSARERREDQQLLQHEDTVRAVYKKHAQNFFEEIKEGFLREAATLRKQAQRALTNGPKTPAAVLDAGAPELGANELQLQVSALQRQVAELAGDSPRPKAILDGPKCPKGERRAPCDDRDPGVALRARMDKQQEELRNLARHVQSEFSFAKKATLTPMWKERALQEIAQGELRGVCADEVSRAFKEFASSLGDREVEAALLRLGEAGPLPWEVRLREELEELREHVVRQLSELSRRADEGTVARAVLVERCGVLEESQSASTKIFEDVLPRLSALGVRVQELESTTDDWAIKSEHTAQRTEFCAVRLEEFSEALAREAKQSEERCRQLDEERCGKLESELGARCAALDSGLKDSRAGWEARCGMLASCLESRCDKLQSALEGRCGGLESRLEERCGAAERGLEERCGQLATLEKSLEERNGKLDSLTLALDDRCGKLETGLKETVGKLEDSFEQRFGKLELGFRDRCEKLEVGLGELHGHAGKAIDERCRELQAGLEERHGKALSELRGAFEERCGQLRTDQEERLSRLRSELLGAVGARSSADTTRLTARLEAAEAAAGSCREAAQRAQAAGESARRLAEDASAEARRAQELAGPAQDVGARMALLEPELRQLRQASETLASEVRGAHAEASAAGGAAARARAEAEGARSLASGLGEAVASSEGSAAHHSARLGALESQAEEHRRQADRLRAVEQRCEALQREAGRLAGAEGRQEELLRQAGRLGESQEERLRKLVERMDELAESSARDSARLGGAEERLEALRSAPERQAPTEKAEVAPRSMSEIGESAEAPDRAYIAARLTAHLETVEVRLQGFHRKAESLSDELASHGRRLADTTTRHSVRLEALEDRSSDFQRQLGALGGDLGLHGRRLADSSAQQAAALGTLDERLGALQRRAEGLGAELAGHTRRVTDTAASHVARLGALEERSGQAQRQGKQLGERLGTLAESLEEARREVAGLSARLGAAEAAASKQRWMPPAEPPAPVAPAPALAPAQSSRQPVQEEAEGIVPQRALEVSGAEASACAPLKPRGLARAEATPASAALRDERAPRRAPEASAGRGAASASVGGSSSGTAARAGASKEPLRPTSAKSWGAESNESLPPDTVIASLVDGRIHGLMENEEEDGELSFAAFSRDSPTSWVDDDDGP